MTAEELAGFAAAYDHHFMAVRAHGAALLDRAYRLRYQVYCVEHRFEDPTLFPDRREIDDEDDRSVHILLVHRRTGDTAGTARVILPRPDRGRVLPIERILSAAGRPPLEAVPLQRTAEVSRFAVSKRFRRRCGEERGADLRFTPDAAPGPGERRLMPYITFGLLHGILGICFERGITHLAAVMEPPLVRLLARLGLRFEPVGGLVEHHGLRQPCVAGLGDLVRHSRDNATLLWRYICDEPATGGGSCERPRSGGLQ
jgi:N-acyl amino acid synthase of PEP-CTERM/exosortase system